MVDGHESTLDHLVRYLVTVAASRLNQRAVCAAFPEKVARETGIVVHVKVLAPLEMAVARAAVDSDTVNDFSDVIIVRELHAFIIDRR